MMFLFQTSRYKYLFSQSISIAIVLSLLVVGTVVAASGDLDPEFYGREFYVHSADVFSGAERSFVDVQDDGKIALAGNGTCDPDCDFLVFRTNVDGSPDQTFGVEGTQIIDLGQDETVQGMTVQSDGKVIILGTSCDDAGECSLLLIRLMPDGAFDLSFDGDGMVQPNFSFIPGIGGSVVIRPNGKIVVLANIRTSIDSYRSAIFQFNTNGSLDSNFGEILGRKALPSTRKIGDQKVRRQGFAFIDFDGHDLVVQPDGSIVIIGIIGSFGSSDFALARMLPAGNALDRSFGVRGKQVTDFGGFESASSVSLQSDGKLVVGGSSTGNFLVARYNPNGSLDKTFNGTGVVITDITADADDSARDCAIQQDGKVLVVGSTNPYGWHKNIVVVRYNVDGSLDTTFGSNGWISLSYFTENFGTSIDIQPDGKSVISGVSLNITGMGDFHYLTLNRILP